MTNLPKPRYCLRYEPEPGVRRVHMHLSHRVSSSPASAFLGENVSKPNSCLLTSPPCPAHLAPAFHSLTLHQRGNGSFLTSLAAELAKERRLKTFLRKHGHHGMEEGRSENSAEALTGIIRPDTLQYHERCHVRTVRKPLLNPLSSMWLQE